MCRIWVRKTKNDPALVVFVVGIEMTGLLHLVFLVSNLPLSDPGLGDQENSPSQNQ